MEMKNLCLAEKVYDHGFNETSKKYGEEQALKAIYIALMKSDFNYITNENNARLCLESVQYPEYIQMLGEFSNRIFEQQINNCTEKDIMDVLKSYDFSGQYNELRSLELYNLAYNKDAALASTMLRFENIKKNVVNTFINKKYNKNEIDFSQIRKEDLISEEYDYSKEEIELMDCHIR